MDTATVVFLMNCFLFASLIQSSPVPASGLPHSFVETVSQANTIVEKILNNLHAVHSATVSIQGLSLDSSPQTSHFQMMEMSMGIPASPVLKILSELFTLDMCVSRMSAGIQMYENILELLSQSLSGLEDVRTDLRDLLTHINKLKEVADVPDDGLDQNPSLDLASQLQDSYRVQVAVHLTLTQLRSFCYDLIRTFRVLSTYRP
ncbi:uncharacterized protein [Nothobranchius furzeri]|uniref:LOC107390300-like protein n=1 Tax=Nothobranchius furzeri TaxID=105023 RepID=A0A8C6MKJ3_NOTFU|nr:uncharacterized protein LOC107390300 [Nothobranchius furzeri]KAF7218082.1 putative LOC107390300-like protein [Nothobranchius furzeri]